jgi:hypothetical protein
MELQKSVGQYVSEYVRESSAKARRKPGSRNSLAKRAKGQGNLNGLDPGETLILWGLLPLFEAANGLEFYVAMHNIWGLGIRRLLEGYPRGVLT